MNLTDEARMIEPNKTALCTTLLQCDPFESQRRNNPWKPFYFFMGLFLEKLLIGKSNFSTKTNWLLLNS